MAQSQRLGLNHRLDLDQIRRAANLLQHLQLAAGLQCAFENQILNEMRDDAVLALRGDDHQPFGSGLSGLLGHQLNTGRIHHRQQFFGDGLGRRQEASAQPCRRHDGRSGKPNMGSGHAHTLTNRIPRTSGMASLGLR